MNFNEWVIKSTDAKAAYETHGKDDSTSKAELSNETGHKWNFWVTETSSQTCRVKKDARKSEQSCFLVQTRSVSKQEAGMTILCKTRNKTIQIRFVTRETQLNNFSPHAGDAVKLNFAVEDLLRNPKQEADDLKLIFWWEHHVAKMFVRIDKFIHLYYFLKFYLRKSFCYKKISLIFGGNIFLMRFLPTLANFCVNKMGR